MFAGLENPMHLLLLLLVLLILFGAKRLPEIGRSLGTGMREFKESITGQAAASQPTPSIPRALEEATSAPANASTIKPREADPVDAG